MEDERSTPGQPPGAGPVLPEEREAGGWDAVVVRLRELRTSAGAPSYRAIADRIAADRRAAGADPFAARVGKTTVYDCFQLGRRRMNPSLLREVCRALGGDDAQVDRWLADDGTPAEPSVPASAPAPAEEPGRALPPRPGAATLLLVGAACVVLGVLGRALAFHGQLPLHLDMIGTAVAAFALGPWPAVVVGLLASSCGAAISGSSSFAFAGVNVVGALVWGYGLRRWRCGRSLPRFAVLNSAAGLACSLLATPILVFFGGSTRRGYDGVIGAFESVVSQHALAVFGANLLTSELDKQLSGFVALVLVAGLPRWFARDLPLAQVGRAASAGRP